MTRHANRSQGLGTGAVLAYKTTMVSPWRTGRVALSVLAAAVLGAMHQPGPARADDASDYAGTKCKANQHFNATSGECVAETVTNAVDSFVDHLVTLSDPGANCGANKFYSVTHAACWPDTIFNDPKAPIMVEGQDPSTVAPPTMSGMPCEGDQEKGDGQGNAVENDPFGWCS